MELENYTPEVFVSNFLKDREVFGEDTQYIYEEIFSSILEEKVDLTEFISNIDSIFSGFKYNLLEELQEDETLSENDKKDGTRIINELDLSKLLSIPAKDEIVRSSAMSKEMKDILTPAKAFAPASPDLKNWMKQVGPKGVEKLSTKMTAVGGIKGIFSRLKDKVFSFFGGLKGKSFSQIMNNGLAWLQNPVNLAKALGTTGGIIIIGLILKALKKRRKIKQYKKLQKLTQDGIMREAYEEEFDWRGNIKIFAKAKNEVLTECRVNDALRNALFEEKKEEKKINFFDY